MFSSITDGTNPLGVDVAHNKAATSDLLRLAGLPGAIQSWATSPEEAVKAAKGLGYPVVVKPSDQEKGEGVYADLRNEASVIKAFKLTQEVSKNILIEKYFEGFTHRLTVFQGKVIRVTKRVAGGVVGDGVHDVATLVEYWQIDKDNLRRSRRLGKVLLSVDEEATEMLMQHGLKTSYVPAKGEYICLRRRDNINTGGTNEYLKLEDVHPDNLRLAQDAAGLLRLDFAGIDLIITDITSSWFDVGGMICEINAQPQMGTTNNEEIYQDILLQLLGERSRIPARLIICPAEETLRQQIIQKYLAVDAGNGLSDQSGIWVDHQKVTQSFSSGFFAARALFFRPDINDAICLMTPIEIASNGLPLNHWDSLTIEYSEKMQPQERDALDIAKTFLKGHVN